MTLRSQIKKTTTILKAMTKVIRAKRRRKMTMTMKGQMEVKESLSTKPRSKRVGN